MTDEYRETISKAEIIRDFIAGMTDEYFLAQCRKYLFPEIKTPSL
jgi:dGTPase